MARRRASGTGRGARGAGEGAGGTARAPARAKPREKAAAAGDPLAPYNAKRDFTRTAEPPGAPARADKAATARRGKAPAGDRFIVQKHDARRLHWDFRLEVDGVLKSWAVTRGPSIDPADKRLAVRTEDHPLSYAEFEGTIPAGEYGGGTVMLWDRGTWAPVPGKSAKDIAAGHLHFTLAGERMRGEWLLVRMKPRGKETRENWLLRKVADEAAGEGDALVEHALTSVLTGRTMAEIAAEADDASLAGKHGAAFDKVMAATARANDRAAKAHDAPAGGPRKPGKARNRRAAARPGFAPVQLATLVDAVPTGADWLFEIKFDGYRALAAAAGADVRVFTRSGLDWTEQFAPVATALAALDLPGALLDGEVVALDADGNPSFSVLQTALRDGPPERLVYFAFDLLELGGEDLRPLPNVERKARLAALLAGAPGPLRVAEHVIGAGEALFRAMCAHGQEGIVAKRADAPYRGARTRHWLKIKCTLRQEFVLVGWQPSAARGRPFASLLLAQREDGKLVYKGKVGTGFDGALLADIAHALAPLAQDTAPVAAPRAETRGCRWVKPKLVAEVAFAQFTADGRVRHASFVGLRADKPAREVVAERARPLGDDAAAAGAPAPAGGEAGAGDDIAITHPDRVVFDSGQTKGDLAAYVRAIAPLMLPFAANRPLSLLRCPQGRGKQCFFQKHDSGALGPHVGHVAIREKTGKAEDYLFVRDAAGLLACVQMNTIEFHGWGCRADAVERPDRMIFDLDPDEALDFAEVRRAARTIRDHLAELGLVSFAMLSGGKGIHVVVPLTPGHDWTAHKDFAKRFAEAMSLAAPERFVATMGKARREGRIFIDYLRNQRGSTAVLPYAVRARPGAPVAVPVTWAELDDMASAHVFDIGDAQSLIERARAPGLAGWGMAEQRLPGF